MKKGNRFGLRLSECCYHCTSYADGVCEIADLRVDDFWVCGMYDGSPSLKQQTVDTFTTAVEGEVMKNSEYISKYELRNQFNHLIAKINGDIAQSDLMAEYNKKIGSDSSMNLCLGVSSGLQNAKALVFEGVSELNLSGVLDGDDNSADGVTGGS